MCRCDVMPYIYVTINQNAHNRNLIYFDFFFVCSVAKFNLQLLSADLLQKLTRYGISSCLPLLMELHRPLPFCILSCLRMESSLKKMFPRSLFGFRLAIFESVNQKKSISLPIWKFEAKKARNRIRWIILIQNTDFGCSLENGHCAISC